MKLTPPLSPIVGVRDVRMIESSGSLCFLFEPPHAIFVRSQFGRQDLQSDFAVQPRVFSKIHFTHSARADL